MSRHARTQKAAPAQTHAQATARRAHAAPAPDRRLLVTDRELTDMATYFASQKPPGPAAAKPDPKRRGRGAEVANAMGCGSCHMSDYRGQQHVPRIAHQREDYLVLALKAYRDNKRSGSDTSMNAALYQVSDADIQALAHYLAHYSGK